ncbi:protein TolR [Methyloligella sp. 2.7D]|uniref:protein TolR n=1 Tax=unclassified Methyloligella TaxID=2625955 RepID=UPI00157D25C7|nr:protein TolR [Methyloligella sp. GL2]QKP76833.1 protein TolR [Methyloligella sp. GL2]
MGASLQPAESNGSRARRRRASRPMSEINVTPMVDVMLVLLIIFMVTAPLLTVGVPVDLPKGEANQMQSDDTPLEISVTQDGKIFLQETEMSPDEIVPKLKAISNNNTEARIYVRGDQNVDYGAVLKLMGKINGAGFSRVALIMLPEDAP